MMFRAVFWVILPCKMIVENHYQGQFCLHSYKVSGLMPNADDGIREVGIAMNRWMMECCSIAACLEGLTSAV
jgi:hypothetical protein